MNSIPFKSIPLLAFLLSLPTVSGSDLESLLEDRAAKQTTVWQNETLAQEYETAFIQFWDDLRNSDEPEEVFKSFSFSSLKFGEFSDAVTLDHGIEGRTIGKANRAMSYTEWQSWLESMETLGYALDQTEWHHKEFIAGEDAPSESVFSFTLHVKNAPLNTRVILDGRFRVVWKAGKSAEGIYVPEKIEVTELEILQRKGEPLFRRLGIFDIPPLQRGPVLAYDLDRNGFSEIILPKANQIAWNTGNDYRQAKLNKAAVTNCRSAVLADFNQDGHTDLIIDGSVVLSFGAPELIGMFIFKGSAGGKFEASPEPLVIDSLLEVKADTTLTAGDIDGDGDLDLWLGQYKDPYVGGSMPTPFFDANDGHPSYLLVNQGDGITFKEETRQRGITEKRFRRIYSSSFFDYDQDGDLDLLNVCDFSGIDLFENDGSGTFKDVTSETFEERFLFGMSHSFADFNYDGRLDLYAIGMSSTTASRLHKMGAQPEDMEELTRMRIPMTFGNRLYYSQANGAFEQPSNAGQVARTGWSWGVVTVDFDNDGDIEFYVGNGHDSNTTARDYCTSYWTDDIYRGSSIENPLYQDYFGEKMSHKEEHGISWNGFEHNFLFMPMPDGRSRNISYLAGVALERDCRMVVADDVNMDGRLDLIIDSSPPDWDPPTQGTTLEVYLNQIPETGNFIGVRLEDKKGAPSSTAASILVSAGGKVHASANLNGDSYESQHAAIKHFGIGQSTTVEYIEVTWMDGSKKRLENPAINKYHLIEHSD
ncbi:MAG: CRTAC1 family protein [Puniceicoccaceae bacterium]